MNTMNENFSFPVYDLTPTDEAEGIGCYAYMLNEVLGRKEVKNIAIAGRYGSGKSSFLNTFFKSRKNENVLRISMAAFLEKEGEQKMDEPRERLLEISILQQMFYHVTQDDLPFSRFRRLTRFEKGTWGPLLAYVALLVLSLICMVQPHSMTQHLSPCFVSEWTNVIYWGGVGLCGVMSSIGIVHLLRFYKKIKHCNLNFQNIELDIKKEDETSVFNRYMDEVVYFFEETGYKIVLFEDIDRFKDVRIFTKLRELNLILNRAKQIQQKPIRFIYALRDNMFTGTERVKFFDFILPIVPVIDSKSSAAKLKEMLAEYVGKNGVAEYDEMVHALAPYVSDMRLMNNIMNEFAAYREQISKQGNGTRFLGMAIFKNFFPAEFAKLYERTDSLLSRILARKKEVIAEKKAEFEKKIKECEAAVSKAEKELCGTIAELQSLYMARCVGRELPDGAMSIEWKGQNETGLSEFFNNPALFDSLYGKDFCISFCKKIPGYSNYWDQRSVNCEWASKYLQVKNELGEYRDRVKAVGDKVEKKKEAYKFQIAELISERSSVYRLTLCELLKKGWVGEGDIEAALRACCSESKVKGGEEPPKQSVKRETVLLLYQLLYGGYVGENYEHFISVFKKGDMSREDNDFETAVLENVEHQFDRKLDKPASVADHLGVGMFTKPAVRNLALIKTMIMAGNRYKEKLDSFASRFVKNDADNHRFAIDLILQVAEDDDGVAKVIEFLVEHWKSCLDDLFKGECLTEDEKPKLAEASLRWMKSRQSALPIEVGEYIVATKHPCELFKKTGYDPAMMVKILDDSELSLRNCVFESEEEKTYVEAVRHAGCYLYGNGMLERILAASDIDVTNFGRAPMTCIRKSELQDVIADVNENFDCFVETFYLGNDVVREDAPEIVADVLNTTTFDLKDRERFAKVQKHLIDDLTLIKEDELAKRLLLANMISPNWKNVAHAAERFAYDGGALGFLNKNHEVLANQDYRQVEDSLRKWVDWLISTETLSEETLKIALDLFPASIKIRNLSKVDVSAKRVRIAAACARIVFSPEIYEQLKKAGKDGHMELAEVYSNEFIQACKIHSWKLTHKDLARIFMGSCFTGDQKIDLLKTHEGSASNVAVAKAIASFLSEDNYMKVSASVLENAFPHLTQSDVQVLILLRLDPAPEKVKAMLLKLKEPYKDALVAKGWEKHEPMTLSKSFMQFLIRKGLITKEKK